MIDWMPTILSLAGFKGTVDITNARHKSAIYSSFDCYYLSCLMFVISRFYYNIVSSLSTICLSMIFMALRSSSFNQYTHHDFAVV